MPAHNAHVPTDETRAVAERMSRAGVKQETICKALGISLPTLHKHYREELDRGESEALDKIGTTLFEKAIGGDTTALIFLAKTRLGFREVQRVEQTGADGGPIEYTDAPRERIAGRLARLKVVGGTEHDS